MIPRLVRCTRCHAKQGSPCRARRGNLIVFVRPHRERRHHAALSLIVISLFPLWIAWTAAHAISDWLCCRWQQTLTPTDQKR